MLPVDEVSMAVDPDEYTSLRQKLHAWALRKATRKRLRNWLIRIVVAALLCVWLYWIIRLGPAMHSELSELNRKVNKRGIDEQHRSGKDRNGGDKNMRKVRV